MRGSIHQRMNISFTSYQFPMLPFDNIVEIELQLKKILGNDSVVKCMKINSTTVVAIIYPHRVKHASCLDTPKKCIEYLELNGFGQ